MSLVACANFQNELGALPFFASEALLYKRNDEIKISSTRLVCLIFLLIERHQGAAFAAAGARAARGRRVRDWPTLYLVVD
jgi:hypothetical protein